MPSILFELINTLRIFDKPIVQFTDNVAITRSGLSTAWDVLNAQDAILAFFLF
jgi:hypothetical protein